MPKKKFKPMRGDAHLKCQCGRLINPDWEYTHCAPCMRKQDKQFINEKAQEWAGKNSDGALTEVSPQLRRWSKGGIHCLMTDKNCATCDNSLSTGLMENTNNESKRCQMPSFVGFLVNNGLRPTVPMVQRYGYGKDFRRDETDV